MTMNKIFSGLIFSMIAIVAQAQTKPETFTDIPRPHVEPVIPHPTKVVLTPKQLEQLVKDHQLIGKQLVKDCFDSTVGHICLDEIVSYLGKEKEDYVEFRIVKFNQTPVPDSYPYRVSIYLDKDSKIKTVKIQ